jgi:hypothetical protein
MLYLAYGSNLNLGQMRLRCPRAEPLYSMIIKDHRLVFRGVADMIEDKGSRCAIGVFNITDQCEASLDIYEGYPKLYGKKILTIDGEDIMTYTMNRETISPPSELYYNSIFEGYEDFGLDSTLLEQARADSFIHCARW